jgi:hypothetical protein
LAVVVVVVDFLIPYLIISVQVVLQVLTVVAVEELPRPLLARL